jgi:hypothetical protein
VNGNWVLDPHTPSEKDHEGNENNILTIDDLLKLPVVGADTTASAMEKEEEGKTATVESAPVTEGSTQSTGATDPATKEVTVEESGPVAEATEEAETQASVTDQVKDKVLEVAAPVTAAVAAASAAVVGFMTGHENSGRETSPIPGTFPETPVLEKTEESTVPLVDEVKKTDDEPVPGAVVPLQPVEGTSKVPETSDSTVAPVALGTASESGGFSDKHESATDLVDETHDHTVEKLTGAGAAGAAGFAAALAADKEANTAPTSTYIPSSSTMLDAPEKNGSFGILPVPSATAPEGTKPLAKSTYKDPEITENVGSLVPEPVAEKSVEPVPETKFEPVTSEDNIISSSKATEGIESGTVAGAVTGATTTATTHIEELKSAALKSSEHAAQTAAKALAEDAPTPPTLDAKSTLSGLTPGAGVTAIGTATDKESEETGLSRLVARKMDEKVDVEADAKAAHVEPAIILDDTKLSKPIVETLGTSGSAAVASTPINVSVPTSDGVQEVIALGTAIVTDGGKESEKLKDELLNNGKTNLPEGALAHLSKSTDNPVAPATPEKTVAKETSTSPATPVKDSPATPSKTPASQSSAAKTKKDRPVSGVPSEAGSEKKKKGGFLKRLKKILS